MKKWIVKYTSDKETFKTTEIHGTSYTDAFVNFMVAYPGGIVCEIKEA
jgi:hypothetical protein